MQKPWHTNYPARLAREIFLRCAAAYGGPGKKLRVYDPCCGGGYILTVLGFLHGDKIESLYGSDISENAVELAEANLGLLSPEGLAERKGRLGELYAAHGKESHRLATESVERLSALTRRVGDSRVFNRDILNGREQPPFDFKADVVIADIPYGRISYWSSFPAVAVCRMLANISGVLGEGAVVAVSGGKNLKFYTPGYCRVEKFIIGKRKIEILRPTDDG
jgi:SAM-dependent methyltransferase